MAAAINEMTAHFSVVSWVAARQVSSYSYIRTNRQNPLEWRITSAFESAIFSPLPSHRTAEEGRSIGDLERE